MHREVSVFLASMAMGEYVAYTDCRMFEAFFRKKGDEKLAASYMDIAREESEHFRAIRKGLKSKATVPSELKAIFRGDYLFDAENILEKILLVHMVFEPAAFSYFSLLASQAHVKLLGQDANYFVSVFKKILVEESQHMKVGHHFIQHQDFFELNESIQSELVASIRRHKAALIAATHIIFKENISFAEELCQSFDVKVEQLIHRHLRSIK